MAASEPGALFPELGIPAELMQILARDYGNRNKTLVMFNLLLCLPRRVALQPGDPVAPVSTRLSSRLSRRCQAVMHVTWRLGLRLRY
jgi:hypothetical protein